MHVICNSFRYVGRQHYEVIVKCQACLHGPSEAVAKSRFAEFAAEWDEASCDRAALGRITVPFLEYDT